MAGITQKLDIETARKSPSIDLWPKSDLRPMIDLRFKLKFETEQNEPVPILCGCPMQTGNCLQKVDEVSIPEEAGSHAILRDSPN